MIENQVKPLVVAARVLNMNILNLVRKAPFNRFGWAIADRWALNSPAALVQLQEMGEVVLFNRLLEQQKIEQEINIQNMAHPNEGMTKSEILSINEITTELT